MKRIVLAVLLFLGAMATSSKQSSAQGTLIHYWHFNSFTGSMYTPTINAVPADFTLIPSANPRILYAPKPGTSPAYNTYCDNVGLDATGPLDYDTVNARMSQPSGNGFRTRNPSDSMYLYYYIPTTGYRHIVLIYATEPSSLIHGMIQQIFDYSTDGGTNWTNTLLSTPMHDFTVPSPDSTMQRVRVTFTSDSAVNNNPNLVFRIHFNINTTATGPGSGNDRFDNITVEGDVYTTTGITEKNSALVNYTIYPNPAAGQLDITSDLEGTKSVAISNVIGQKIYAGTADGKNFSVNVSNLVTGNYFITISESSTGSVRTMRFVKQ